MQFQIASDLHLDMGNLGGQARHGPLVACAADYLILAGDIDRIDKVRARFADWPCPVIYVRGNHDSYFTSYEAGIRSARSVSDGKLFHFLERGVLVLRGVRVIGCCLWTDFELFGRLDDALLLAGHIGADFRCIYRADGLRFSPSDARHEHLVSVEWLGRVLNEPYDGVNVVVTHHAPHPRSLDPGRGRNRLDSAFASDLSQLMRNVHLWVHGHVHYSSDYKMKRCRVICNPAGSLQHPNPFFDPAMIVEV